MGGTPSSVTEANLVAVETDEDKLGNTSEGDVATTHSEKIEMINPYSSEDGRFPLDLKSIRGYDRETLIRRMAYAIKHEGWVPNIDELKALVCMDAYTIVTERKNLGDAYRTDFFAKHPLPWPDGAVETGEILDDGLGPDYTDGPTGYNLWEFARIRTEMGEAMDGYLGYMLGADAILNFLEITINQLTAEDRIEFLRYIIENTSTFSLIDRDDFIENLYNMAYSELDPTSDTALDAGIAIATSLGNVMRRDPSLIRNNFFDYNYEYYSSLFHATHNPQRREVLYRGIASSEDSELLSPYLIGVLLRSAYNKLPTILTEISTLANNDRLSPQERDRLTAVLRRLMGIGEGKEITLQTESMYEVFHMEDYETSLKTREYRGKMLKEVFQRNGVPENATILDEATGTGWLANDLSKLGYHVIAFDLTARNLDIAKKGEGTYFQSDWNNIPLGNKSVEVVTNLGRNLPHCDGVLDFNNTLREMRRLLKNDGLVVFDMPDPKRGEYWKRLQKYRKYLERMGYTEEELSDFWYEVSSPDGVHFNDRYIPPQEDVEHSIAVAGLELVEVIREEIPNSNGDYNIVYVAKKNHKNPSN